MAPIRKQLEPKRAFPFQIIYKQKKGLQHELPEHTHEWLEVIIIHKGSGTFFIDQTFYDLHEGDIILIPSNIIHRTIPDKDKLLTSTAIFFSSALLNHTGFGNSFLYWRIFEEAKRRKNYKYSFHSDHYKQLTQYLTILKKEAEMANPDQENALLVWLHVILLHLNRHCLPIASVPTEQSTFGPEWIREALIYIDQHLEIDLDLQYLSKRVAVSPAHFSRVFKNLVGVNVTEYITVKRVLLAKELLLNFDEKISTIAFQCGFKAMPHFYRTFKKHTSMTPSEYRKNSLIDTNY
ncbi:AraC family transcriptional regulator [Mesobacillus foraminis]|uniref:AraC family transcriptional regulator n=1 Tax=Mesobacillus foraminis TaxID=279826 RepID=UPI000EF44738|nr:AraC family transcriptional regulator [Mesobacillus foraminis]